MELIRDTEHTKVSVMDEKGQGNANHEYHITWDPDNNGYIATQSIKFQNGPIQENKVNGCQNEDLLAIVIHRLQGFQSGDYACRDNANALKHLEEALLWLNHRTEKR